MRFVFRLCRDLGIDDPIAYLDRVPRAVVDAWLAYYLEEQSGSKADKQKMSPAEALQTLSSRHG